MQPIDRHFIDTLTAGLATGPRSSARLDQRNTGADPSPHLDQRTTGPGASTHLDHSATASGSGTGSSPAGAQDLLDLFDAQARSRHVDFAARDLQQQGKAFYTIGSAGHEANAAVAMALRPTDPALLHYRSGAFYVARAMQVPDSTPVRDLIGSLMCSTDDPISGGRHKVIGHPGLAILPQTSTIASHLPRAVGLALTLDRGFLVRRTYPDDAVVVASIGDASANHSTAVGAINSASYLAHQSVPLPLLIVVEDNGIGISVKTPQGWTERSLSSHPGIDYHFADGTDIDQLMSVTRQAVEGVRRARRPAILHLRTVRFMGHAGSDVEMAYRSSREIVLDHQRDPLLATADALITSGVLTAGEVLNRYEGLRDEVAREAARDVVHLATAREVTAPLNPPARAEISRPDATARSVAFSGRLPEDAGPMTLAQSINATLTDLMVAHPETLVFGEDVARKGGVYGVTRGLRNRFGSRRVFDTLLDEQTVLGTALGAAVAGALAIPEIQYLAYLHNAEDQLRGEAATLRFFSNGQYQNPMIVRIPGLAYQRGFGGHFHNDNSLAVLRDIPGLVLGVPSSAAEAPGMLRTMAALALEEGRVCVYVEPIALYHSRDLFPGDGALLADYQPPQEWDLHARLGSTTLHERPGADRLIVTFGNGVSMSLRAAARAAENGIHADVLDLRWLAPLPVTELIAHAERYPHVVIADETRRSGGVSESIIAALVDDGYRGSITRITSVDSIIPLGPAAATVLMQEDQILQALTTNHATQMNPEKENAR